MDVSIIVVSWNTKELLCDCLGSILEQAGDVDYDIIVVDNASSDGSADMVRSRFPEATLIVEQTNRGYAAAINDGIRVAQGRYVLVLNSDTLICDGAIAKTVGYADRHPEAAVVGCQVRESPDKVQMTCLRFPSLLNLFLWASGLARVFKNNHFFGQEHMLWWQRDSEREVDVVSGMFMLVRREAIDEVGLMDDGYFMYYEDTDWCYRFAKAGWKMVFWPEAAILHIEGGSGSTKQQPPEMFVQQQKSLLRFFQEHHGVVAFFIARLFLLIVNGSRSCLWGMRSAMSRLLYKSSLREWNEASKYWDGVRYCVFGIEPERVNRES